MYYCGVRDRGDGEVLEVSALGLSVVVHKMLALFVVLDGDPVTPAAIHGDSRGRCDGGCDGPGVRSENHATTIR